MMREILITITLMGLLCAKATTTSAASISVDVDPGTPGVQVVRTVTALTAFDVDIVVTGVVSTMPLNGFEFDLSFDSIFLTATSVVDGGFLLPTVFVAQNTISASSVEFAEVTLGSSGASGSGVLATVSFTADANGISTLDLSNVLFSAPFGVPISVDPINDATVHVVPIPPMLSLFGAALAGLGVIGWRKRKAE